MPSTPKTQQPNTLYTTNNNKTTPLIQALETCQKLLDIQKLLETYQHSQLDNQKEASFKSKTRFCSRESFNILPLSSSLLLSFVAPRWEDRCDLAVTTTAMFHPQGENFNYGALSTKPASPLTIKF